MRAGWAVPANGTPHMAILNRVTVAGTGTLKWNGATITHNQLRRYLGEVGELRPMPFTILLPDPNADCAFLEAVRDDMARALPCDQACGEGRGDWLSGSRPRKLSPEAEGERANAIAEVEAIVDGLSENTASPER